uniref:Haloacid dehalogenase-like hydrolase domain-containing protein 2 n=1 Tax=Panagrellus redivivus TaxID=6233 RepID=A0A7E4W3J9_PANRE
MIKPKFAVLIDLSGTLFIDDAAIPGAVTALKTLLDNPLFAVKFVTNTTKESVPNLLKRLHHVGFSYISQEQVFTSLTSARNLVEARSLKPMLLLEPEAIGEFEGIQSDATGVPQSDLNAVVVGLAPSQFHFERLNSAFRLLHANSDAVLIGIHKGRYYQRKDGLALGPGPFVAGLEYVSGRKAIVVGKPEQEFFQNAIRTLPSTFSPENVVMIGDDVNDDVLGSNAIGYKSILVKTGKYRNGDEENITSLPTAFVFPSVVEAISEILKNGGVVFGSA